MPHFKFISLIIFLFVFTSDCPPSPGIDQEFTDYLTDEDWEVEQVTNTCNSEDITASYSGFTIGFSHNSSASDSTTIVFNFTSSNGSPAFPGSGFLSFSRSQLDENQATAERNDGITMIFKNLTSNVDDGQYLDMDVKDIIECEADSSEKTISRELRRGDHSFRCRRRS